MNERIRQLAEQATTYIEPTSNSGEGWIFDKEKFAELIVKECMTVGFNAVYNVEDDSNAIVVYTEIKQHFGVE
jgi:hypothetical protein